MYQFASVVRWGRHSGSGGAGLLERVSQPLPVPVRPVRAAAAGAGEGAVLLTLDLAVVAVVSFAAGSLWAAVLIRAGYRTAFFEVLDEEERSHVKAIALQRWNGAPDSGRWVHQTNLTLPTPAPTEQLALSA